MEVVIHMRQKRGEKIHTYIRRFQQRCIESGLDQYYVPMIVALLSSLEKKNAAYNLVSAKFGAEFINQTLENMVQYVASLQLDDHDGEKRTRGDYDDHRLTRRPKLNHHFKTNSSNNKKLDDCHYCNKPR